MLTVTDTEGAEASCSAFVTLLDVTAPTVNCPGDVTRECASPGGTAAGFQFAGIDNCDPTPFTSCTVSPDAVLPAGDTSVQCEASDRAANRSFCDFSVLVIDTLQPRVTAPPPVVAECTPPQGTAVALGVATAADQCSGPLAVTSNAPVLFPAGPTTVTWRAEDVSGNVGKGVQPVTVRDTTPPAITAPPRKVLECTSPAGASSAAIGVATAGDGCDAAPVVSNSAPPILPIGDTSITWTARDSTGHVSTALQLVTVGDTTPPRIASISATSAVLWPPNGQFVPVRVNVEAADGCDAAPSCRITRIRSNQGDASDWAITGALSAQLRARRSGSGGDRLYWFRGLGHGSRAAAGRGPTRVVHRSRDVPVRTRAVRVAWGRRSDTSAKPSSRRGSQTLAASVDESCLPRRSSRSERRRAGRAIFSNTPA